MLSNISSELKRKPAIRGTIVMAFMIVMIVMIFMAFSRTLEFNRQSSNYHDDPESFNSSGTSDEDFDDSPDLNITIPKVFLNIGKQEYRIYEYFSGFGYKMSRPNKYHPKVICQDIKENIKEPEVLNYIDLIHTSGNISDEDANFICAASNFFNTKAFLNFCQGFITQELPEPLKSNKIVPEVGLRVADKEYPLHDLHSMGLYGWTPEQYRSREICLTNRHVFNDSNVLEIFDLLRTSGPLNISDEDANAYCAAASFLTRRPFGELLQNEISDIIYPNMSLPENRTLLMDYYLHFHKHNFTSLRKQIFEGILHNYEQFLASPELANYSLEELESIVLPLYRHNPSAEMRKAILGCYREWIEKEPEVRCGAQHRFTPSVSVREVADMMDCNRDSNSIPTGS